jgi:hypothetical protein
MICTVVFYDYYFLETFCPVDLIMQIIDAGHIIRI